MESQGKSPMPKEYQMQVPWRDAAHKPGIHMCRCSQTPIRKVTEPLKSTVHPQPQIGGEGGAKP